MQNKLILGLGETPNTEKLYGAPGFGYISAKNYNYLKNENLVFLPDFKYKFKEDNPETPPYLLELSIKKSEGFKKNEPNE